MTAEQFAYWMQGFAELTGDEPPTPAQWKSMKEHLQTVFVKVTPAFKRDAPYTADPIDLSKLGPAIPYTAPRTGAPQRHWWDMPQVTCTAISSGVAAETYC